MLIVFFFCFSPLKTATQTHEISKKDACPICFEEYRGDPAEILMGYMKKCGHYFHFDCIWTWLENRGNCPLCREKVMLTEEDIKAVALRHILNNSSSIVQDASNNIVNKPTEEEVNPSVSITDETVVYNNTNDGTTADGATVQDNPADEATGQDNRTFTKEESQETQSRAVSVVDRSGAQPVDGSSKRDSSEADILEDSCIQVDVHGNMTPPAGQVSLMYWPLHLPETTNSAVTNKAKLSVLSNASMDEQWEQPKGIIIEHIGEVQT